MNILKFLEEFTDDNMMSQTSSRRDVFGTFGSLSKKLAIAAVPLVWQPHLQNLMEQWQQQRQIQLEHCNLPLR